MSWKRLFAARILERGYDYYCDDAVENMEIAADSIRADVIGTEEYEVEITLRNGEAVKRTTAPRPLPSRSLSGKRILTW